MCGTGWTHRCRHAGTGPSPETGRPTRDTGSSGPPRKTGTSREMRRRVSRRTRSRSPEPAGSHPVVGCGHEPVEPVAEPVVDPETRIVLVMVIGGLDAETIGE